MNVKQKQKLLNSPLPVVDAAAQAPLELRGSVLARRAVVSLSVKTRRREERGGGGSGGEGFRNRVVFEI